MASGTQGYEAAQSGVIEKIIERFKNRKKDDGDGKDGKSPAPNQPASVSIATPTSVSYTHLTLPTSDLV